MVQVLEISVEPGTRQVLGAEAHKGAREAPAPAVVVGQLGAVEYGADGRQRGRLDPICLCLLLPTRVDLRVKRGKQK